MSYDIRVVPLVGTWIEILTSSLSSFVISSFPLWERGLKLKPCFQLRKAVGSFPLWERGLKFVGFDTRRIRAAVVPLVGTWIEIGMRLLPSYVFRVVPLAGTWIAIRPPIPSAKVPGVGPLVGTWIEISKNCLIAALHSVVPLAGTWIEICSWQSHCSPGSSIPTWERKLDYYHSRYRRPCTRLIHL